MRLVRFGLRGSIATADGPSATTMEVAGVPPTMDTIPCTTTKKMTTISMPTTTIGGGSTTTDEGWYHECALQRMAGDDLKAKDQCKRKTVVRRIY
jgi:hypothetical protein